MNGTDEFTRRIHRSGRLTMALGFLVSVGAPLYLLTVEDLWPGWRVILVAFGALATLLVLSWFIEPLAYFPMLGSAGTYQAWLVGNISNKLLPAAVTAQAVVDARPGTRRAEVVAICAIAGAVVVHVASLLLLVGIAGPFLLTLFPDRVIDAFAYVVPAIVGPVLVQLAFVNRQRSVAVTAIGISGVLALLVVAIAPSATSFAMVFAVTTTVGICYLRAAKQATP